MPIVVLPISVFRVMDESRSFPIADEPERGCSSTFGKWAGSSLAGEGLGGGAGCANSGRSAVNVSSARPTDRTNTGNGRRGMANPVREMTSDDCSDAQQLTPLV